jgi:hypothetical protein
MLICEVLIQNPGYLSRYSNWLLADGRGVGVRGPVRAIFPLFSTSSRPVLGPTQAPIQWVPKVLPWAVLAEVKNAWMCTSTPHTPWWRSAKLVKHRDNFTFFLSADTGDTAVRTPLGACMYLCVFQCCVLSHVGGYLEKADPPFRNHMSINKIPKPGKLETLDLTAYCTALQERRSQAERTIFWG